MKKGNSCSKSTMWLLTMLVAAGAAFGRDPSLANAPYMDASLGVDARLDDLVSRMTLEEKVAALVCAADMAIAAMPAPQWISGDTADPAKPAPMLAKEFSLGAKPTNAVFSVAVAGWCEVYVNGAKAGNDVLSPVTCQPDERVSSLEFSVADLLKPGKNTLEVLLGNGWHNTFTICAWWFESAPWVSSPKICGKLDCDGQTLFVTDGAWRAYDSPIIFNGLRNGEWYDARKEGVRGNLRGAKVEKYAPWGVVSPEDAVPCREFELFEPKRVLKSPQGLDIYDFGANIAGWCEIEVEGAAGAKVAIDYDESLADDGSLLGHVKQHTKGRGEKRPVQHDEYTLAGRSGGERWHPRFTYHGFRYAQVALSGEVRIKSIRSRFVHSAFERAGTLETSDATFAALQSATERSYLSNFVGIPTDCPHREKNGWTGDAQLAMETGLWNYDAKASYVHFLRMMLDAQRPNGAVPCILPCSPKFGFFWGSGPAWDAILFEIPWQLYRFYGDDAQAREAYPAMKRYVSFIEGKADGDGLYDYGLGDWCVPKTQKRTPTRLTDSAYVYEFNRRAAFWAERFGEKEYAAERNAAAERVKAAFNAAFYKGDGLYEDGQLAALSAPLYFKGLCVNGEEEKVAKRLVETVRANRHLAYFGILGAKWATRVLADYGYADDAFRMFVQPEMPGWAYSLQFGDGTLRESWNGSDSHNHIMFGDLSAWAYEYAAGIVPLEPGFRKVAFRPHVLEGVDSLVATHKTPFGELKAGWRRVGGKVEFICEGPFSSPRDEPAPFRDGDRVVFFGDSITHGGSYGEYVNLFYATRYPGRSIWFSNSGWSGASAQQGLWSIEDDIVAKRPTVVTVMFGMNDINRDAWPRANDTPALAAKRESAIRTYDERMSELVRRVREEAGNPEIVYFTPTPYDQTCLVDGKPSGIVCNDGLAILADHVRSWAARDKATCVDLQKAMLAINAAMQEKDPSASLVRGSPTWFDRVHPGPVGHTVMLYEILKAQKADGLVDEIERDAKGADALAFSCTEKSLPFPMTANMRGALGLVPFERDFNREILRVRNLKEGRYAVKIDGAEVGSWTAAELAEGVNLALNEKTPQYRQAAGAAEICRRLWSGERMLRDFATRRRWMRKNYKLDPDAPGAVEGLVERLLAEGKGEDSYNVKTYRAYLKNWPRHAEFEEAVVKDRAALAESVRPGEHRFEIAPALRPAPHN